MKKQNTLILIIWVIYPIFFILLFLFYFFTCSSKKKHIEPEEKVGKIEQPIKERKFAMIVVPEQLSDPKERMNYLVENYWYYFDFSDTVYINPPQPVDEAIANYVDVLNHADKEVAIKSIKKTLLLADKNSVMYNFFLDTYKKYLHDPNSPIRNDEFYIPVLEYIIASPKTSETDVERAKFELQMLMKNRVGEIAGDFTYTLLSGKTGTLYKLQANYTLLMFYNPDCHACEETISQLKSSPIVQDALNDNGLSILTFYPDADLDIWRKHLSDIPDSWINGYDKYQTVKNKQLYDLKAIPTLYLLDKDKRVILKDVDFIKLEHWLQSNKPAMLSDN